MGNQPKLNPQPFFNGQLTAHGIIKDRAGKVIRYFNVDFNACWVDGVGTLNACIPELITQKIPLPVNDLCTLHARINGVFEAGESVVRRYNRGGGI